MRNTLKFVSLFFVVLALAIPLVSTSAQQVAEPCPADAVAAVNYDDGNAVLVNGQGSLLHVDGETIAIPSQGSVWILGINGAMAEVCLPMEDGASIRGFVSTSFFEAPAEAVQQQATPVATPEGMSVDAPDETLFGVPPRPLSAPANVIGTIDWDEQRLIADWIVQPGLVPGVDLQYAQSGVDGTLEFEDLMIPEGTQLLVGGVRARVTIEINGVEDTRVYEGGVYAVFPENLIIGQISVVDGFMALALEDEGQIEFCARVAQAEAQGWAKENVFPWIFWADPICTGPYDVPLDSDRENGGTLPLATPVPGNES